MANRLLPEAARDGRLLDVGCGSHPFFLLSTRFSERVGVDKMVPTAGATIDGVRLVHHDVESAPRLPFEDERFQAVTMLAVFEHIPRPHLGPLLAEVRRVLTSGGTFVMTTPAGWTDPILRTMARLRLVSHEEIEEHQDRYDHRIIRSHLENAGFGDDRIRQGSFELGMNLWATAVK